MHKDGGHRHDKGDPQGLHDHKMYEKKHPESPKSRILEIKETSHRVGNKIITNRVVKLVMRKPKRARKQRKSNRR